MFVFFFVLLIVTIVAGLCYVWFWLIGFFIHDKFVRISLAVLLGIASFIGLLAIISTMFPKGLGGC